MKYKHPIKSSENKFLLGWFVLASVLAHLLFISLVDDEDEQGLGLFLQAGWADKEVSELSFHVGTGIAWTGAFPGRDEDVLGLGITHVHFSDKARTMFPKSNENVLELFYKIRIAKWCEVKPDIQYIVNPGGLKTEGVVVGTLRLQIKW